MINVYLLNLGTYSVAQLTNDSNYNFQATAWEANSQSFYVHQTLANEPYTEKNFLMSIDGTLISPIEIQGIITK